MAYLYVVEGLSQLQDVEHLPDNVIRAARQALNAAADRAKASASRQIRQEVNFTQPYLAQRLKVRERAMGSNLQAVITGRDRPTSLARFAANRSPSSARKNGYVDVKVKQSTKRITGGFLIELRNGNIGLALRLKPGETIKGKKSAAKELFPNVYLLYGPSVDQAFQTIVDKETLTDEVLDFLEKEFLRLLALNGG